MALRINLGELFHDCANRYDDRPCITIAPSGQTLSYAELERYINRFAHGLRAEFGASHRYMAIMLENGIPYLGASYALKKLDMIEVSINRAFRGPALARMINLPQPRVLITSTAHLDALSAIKDKLLHLEVLIMTDGIDEAKEIFPELKVIAFDALLSTDSHHITPQAADDEVAVIMFTSGTTGLSKGCMLSHRYAVRTAENMIAPFRITKDDVNYTPYPLSHIGPAFYDILPTWMMGGRVILRDGFSLSNFWPEIVEFGATWFMCLGSVQQLLYAAMPSEAEKQHKVTRCWSTPAPVPKADFDKRFGLHLIPGGGYGSTDAGWVVVPQWDHPGGVVLPHYEVAIVDEHDDALPPFAKGEMVIRPREPGVMADGYLGMADKTLETRRNLWFHTGDIGYLDDEGLFYFCCRMAERIRVRGEMVSGYEVEEAVLLHEAIEDAAAIGVPAALGEEDVVLFAVLKKGATLSEEALLSHCRKVMAKFMVPAKITFMEELPRTPTGKVEKGHLAQIAKAG